MPPQSLIMALVNVSLQYLDLDAPLIDTSESPIQHHHKKRTAQEFSPSSDIDIDREGDDADFNPDSATCDKKRQRQRWH